MAKKGVRKTEIKHRERKPKRRRREEGIGGGEERERSGEKQNGHRKSCNETRKYV